MAQRAATVGAYNAVADDAAARGTGAPFYAMPQARGQRGASTAAAGGGGSPGAGGDAGRDAAAAECARDGGAAEAEDAATEWAHVAFASLAAGSLARLRAHRDASGGEAGEPPPGERSGAGGWGEETRAGGAKADAPPSPPTPTPHSSGGGTGGAGDGASRRLFRRSFYAPNDGLSLRARLHLTLDKPSYSPLAYVCSLVIVAVVLLSCISFVVETLPQFQTRRAQTLFDELEKFCIAFFTAEYGLRLLTAPAVVPFVRRFANMADLAAILPFYIELILQAGGERDVGSDPGGYARARLVRIVRLVRLFRLVRVSYRNEKLRVVVTALQESADMLAVLIFLLCIATVIGSTLMFYAEEGISRPRRPGEPPVFGGPQFHSIPDTFWWCIVTFMTVGYGDVTPVGPEGQLVAALTMVASFIILALPISVIGANFTQQWIVYKETTLLTRRTGTLGAEFAELKAELEVHTGVLEEIVNVAAARAAAMEERGVALRDAAARAGLAAALHQPPPPRDDEDGLDDNAAADQSPHRHDADAAELAQSPAQQADTPRRSLGSRPVLGAAEAELELLLDELGQDAQAAAETFAMAELISSEDFLTRMDAAATKHHRLAAMDRKGIDACAAVHALLSSLAAERAARPSLESAAEATHVPGLAAAAAAAAALLAGSGLAVGGSPGGVQHSHGHHGDAHSPGNRPLDAVSAATRASKESLDKLMVARREASVHGRDA